MAGQVEVELLTAEFESMTCTVLVIVVHCIQHAGVGDQLL
jgi:hypothetical protein